MKRLLLALISLLIALSAASCGVQNEDGGSSTPQNGDTERPWHMDGAVPSDGDSSSILIAYFTWAENTVVEHPEEIDVDATVSASVLNPGNAAKIAAWIQERTGGELFSIVVTEPYSSDYDECLDRAADEKAENARPELVYHVEGMENYDTIFLGFPNWWYTVPMAVHSFLEEYDFDGKTIIPFVTHGTGGLASTIHDITAGLPDSVTILDAIGVYRPDVNSSQPDVNEWLDGLGFTEEAAALSEASISSDEAAVSSDTAASEENPEKKLTMTFNGESIPIVLYDTPAAAALYAMLPLELTFEDYNNIEKIAYLPEELPVTEEPGSCDPDVGDFCLYAPWGNLSVFYEDFRESSGLVLLGQIESGIELLAGMTGDFTVVLEAVQ